MQNLPIMSTPPAASAQTPAAPSDNNATPAAESFGSVLARQNANTNGPDTDTRNSGQPTSPHADGTDAADIRDNKPIGMQAPAPDGIGVLHGDMLAALLPAAANANGAAANEKPGLCSPLSDNEETGLLAASAPDGVGALPGNMLAMLAPATKTAPDADTSIRLQAAIATGVQGGKQESAENQAVAPSLFRAQGSAMPSAATLAAKTSPLTANAFSAALETTGKDTANATLFNIGTAQVYAQAAQPDGATLTQSGMAPPLTPSQNVPAQAAINTHVTHDTWGDEFNQKITWLATQNEQSAELHLNPPNLGPLNVMLKVSGDQATAMFTSPHAAVRDAVEQALPRLREMLADNGIMLGNATVSDQSPKEHQKGSGNLSGRVGMTPPIGDSIQVGGTVAPIHRHQGMVDTFA